MIVAWIEQNSTTIAWVLGLLVVVFLLVYLFYPALVAAVAPVIDSEEVPLTTTTTTTTATTTGGAIGCKKKENDDGDGDIILSLVIPAYNEELRLEIMLQEAYDYLNQTNCPALQALYQAAASSSLISSSGKQQQQQRQSKTEFILVDDGSQDQTERVFQHFCQARFETNPNIKFRLLRLRHNVGKGAAVQTGMLAARGAFCLMVDADGATAFGPGLEAVAAYASSHDFILGSRADLSPPPLSTTTTTTTTTEIATTTTSAQRSPLRRLLQMGFHLLVVCLVGNSEVQDTQCGFKLFRGHGVVPLLFARLHLRRWAFDTELLYRATGVRLRIREVTVPWHEVEGSKLNTGPLSLARVAVGMLRDMMCVRLCYSLRIWKLPSPLTGQQERDKDK